MDLEGRVTLVTGASRGIGAAVARRLAEAGSHVAIGYGGDGAAAERVAEEVRSLGRRAISVGGDLRDPAASEALAGEAEASLGPVDVLVSNAGIAPKQELAETTVEDWDRVMEVNVRPAFVLAKRLTPGMRGRAGAASSSSRRSPPSPAASSARTTRPRRRHSWALPAPSPRTA